MSVETRLRRIMREVAAGRLSAAGAAERLRHWVFEDLGDLKMDHHRALRKDVPEVVFGEGKTTEQILRAAGALAAKGSAVLVTRAGEDVFRALRRRHPRARWTPASRLIHLPARRAAALRGRVTVLSAGTADIPVAEEAAGTAEALGVRELRRVWDAGVAGIHRLAAHREALMDADAVVCVAGMESALPSVVAGLVRAPVIAVPTSVGYGVALGGLAALASSLASCAPGLMVVNIDNGFGAGYNAALIARAAKTSSPRRVRGRRARAK